MFSPAFILLLMAAPSAASVETAPATATATETAPQTRPAAPAAASSGDEQNRIICRRVSAIGSRVSSTRLCATAAEWARRRNDARQGTDRVQANRSTTGGG